MLPESGQASMLLAQTIGAHTILEIGTLAGYSTIWLARALAPGGRLITLEANPRRAKIALANIAHAGLSNRVDLRLGRALDSPPALAAEGPFDFVFIDADHVEHARILSVGSQALTSRQPHRRGQCCPQREPFSTRAASKPAIQGIRRFYDLVSSRAKGEHDRYTDGRRQGSRRLRHRPRHC